MAGQEPVPFDEATVRKALHDYRDATARYIEHRRLSDDASGERGLALLAMSDAGLSYGEIGKLVGLSAPRVGQIVSSQRAYPPGKSDPDRAARLDALRAEAEGEAG